MVILVTDGAFIRLSRRAIESITTFVSESIIKPYLNKNSSKNVTDSKLHNTIIQSLDDKISKFIAIRNINEQRYASEFSARDITNRLVTHPHSLLICKEIFVNYILMHCCDILWANGIIIPIDCGMQALHDQITSMECLWYSENRLRTDTLVIGTAVIKDIYIDPEFIADVTNDIADLLDPLYEEKKFRTKTPNDTINREKISVINSISNALIQPLSIANMATIIESFYENNEASFFKATIESLKVVKDQPIIGDLENIMKVLLTCAMPKLICKILDNKGLVMNPEYIEKRIFRIIVDAMDIAYAHKTPFYYFTVEEK